MSHIKVLSRGVVLVNPLRSLCLHDMAQRHTTVGTFKVPTQKSPVPLEAPTRHGQVTSIFTRRWTVCPTKRQHAPRSALHCVRDDLEILLLPSPDALASFAA